MSARNGEIENFKIAFTILEDGSKITFGYNKSSSHLVLDTHIALKHKTKWIKDGHRTPEP